MIYGSPFIPNFAKATTVLGGASKSCLLYPLKRTSDLRLSVHALVMLVKMMDRSVAVPDAEAVRRRDGSADKGLGVAHGAFHVVAFGESRGNCRGQRAAGAVGVFGGDAWRWQR